MFKAEEGLLRNELKHECELPPEDDIVVQYINNGFCVNARRKLRRQFLLNPGNLQSKKFLKSSFTLKRETIRHLNWHYYMIHPFSNFAIYSRFTMMLTFLLYFLIIPINIISKNRITTVITLILDTMCLGNILLTFHTGYRDKRRNKVVLSRKEVLKQYLKTWFFVDLISSVNSSVICFLCLSCCKHIYTIYILHFIKLPRIITMFKYFNEFRSYIGLRNYKFKIIKLIFIVFFSITWCFAIIYITRTWDDPNKDRTYMFKLECLQRVISLMFLFGSREEKREVSELILDIICLILGYLLKATLIFNLLQIVTKYSSSGSKFYQLTQQVEEFMRYRNISHTLKNRLMKYFDFRFHQNYYKESEILELFSPSIRQEILVHNYMHLLEKVFVFDDLPISILYSIIYCMKPEIFLPSDVVVTAGTLGDCMYFISSGTVAVFTPTGKEICHLSDGANFGEIALLMENEHRVATVVAIDCCELFVLNRKDFMQKFEKYPEVLGLMRKAAQEKVRKTLIASMRGEENGDVASEFDLESQSRKISSKGYYNFIAEK